MDPKLIMGIGMGLICNMGMVISLGMERTIAEKKLPLHWQASLRWSNHLGITMAKSCHWVKSLRFVPNPAHLFGTSLVIAHNPMWGGVPAPVC